MWRLIGQQPLVPSAGQDRRVAVFGSFNPLCGRLHVHVAARKNSAAFIAHLDKLRQAHRRRHIVDNCSIHHAQCVQRYLADHRAQLTVIWNAAYTPALNLIERYWGHLKATATNNYFLGSVEELECAIIFAVRDFNRSRSQRMLCNLELMRPLRKTAWMTETACLELFCRGFSIRCVAHTQTRIRERREHDSFFVAD